MNRYYHSEKMQVDKQPIKLLLLLPTDTFLIKASCKSKHCRRHHGQLQKILLDVLS